MLEEAMHDKIIAFQMEEEYKHVASRNEHVRGKKNNEHKETYDCFLTQGAKHISSLFYDI